MNILMAVVAVVSDGGRGGDSGRGSGGNDNPVSRRAERRFPIDAILVSGHMHMGASTSYGLHRYLARHPAVRSYGITNSAKEALGYAQERKINTIFIDPCFPGEYFEMEAHKFIAQIRRQFSEIVFVLYATDDCLARFWDACPQYRHYLHLDHILGFQEAEDVYSYDVAVNNIVRRCEEWHISRFEYDIAISFAGEDRKFAADLAERLVSAGARVFYDEYEEARLIGRNLYTHLHQIYSEQCRYCLMLISSAYAKKAWANHERVAAQERALQERGNEYIIPVRLDETPIPGLSSLIGYVNADRGIDKITELIVQKMWITNTTHKLYVGRRLY